MACKGCEERRKQMKAWLHHIADHAKRLKEARSGNANAAADVQAGQGKGQASAQAKGGGQAGNKGAKHREQGVAADTAAGAGEGRVSVPRVRKAGSRKGSTR